MGAHEQQGLLAPPQVFEAFGEATTEAVGDLDTGGGGVPAVDVVVTIPHLDPQQNGHIQVFLNQGTLSEIWQGLVDNPAVTVGREPTDVAIGLLDNDAHLDVVVTNAGDNTLSVLLNQGTGDASFQAATTLNTGSRPCSVVTAQFDCPIGFVDIAQTNCDDNNVWLFVGDALGDFNQTFVKEFG